MQMYGNKDCSIVLLQKEVGIDEYIEACIDIKRVLKFCEQCQNYGSKWSCPPFIFSSKDFWFSYKTLLLYGKKIVLPPELLDIRFEKDALTAWYREILKPIKQGILSELLVMERENPGSMVLSAGSCEQCDLCERAEGLPCKKPEVMRYSLESLGADVAHTLELYLGETLQWAMNGRLPSQFLLLGGLLKR